MIERPDPDRCGYVMDPRDGAQVYWDYFGKGDKETFVFLNGLGMQTSAWYTSVPRVRDDFDVLLFDYRGQGKSTRDDVPYSIPRFCDYLARILDTLGIDKVHTQGVSYGGFVAADFGRLYPDRLHTQTLSGILLSKEQSFRMYQDLSLKFYEGGSDYFDLYTRYLYEKIYGEKFLRRMWGKLEKMRSKFYDNYKDDVRCLVRLTEAQDPFFEALEENYEGYRACTVPTLVISGEHDRVIPLWMQQKLARTYPTCKMVVLPECGHMTYFEEPEAFWGNLKALARAKSIDYELEASTNEEE